ncbi:hypothetical protein PR202_ga09141 [Eleusine coracana subsp. coracana]|uniref:Coatomer subunit delta n=1 Tax=Eleusine coracana subsp. coracana TaxID=191504 RepID=A0AAV5C4E9_ELECO|nr:hypothetical protein PR202_ga09141 [Eleusine coracana subsp. coracana]
MSKSGKVLVSRQFVDMTRGRIEGLLAAFPKLVGTGKQHTYVETQDVRYVYQPIEALYLLVITNKQSNILEDLDTLRLLSKLVSSISLGNKENITVAQVKQYCEMESNEEKLHKLIDRGKSEKAFGPMRTSSNVDMNNRDSGPGGGPLFGDSHKTKDHSLAPTLARSKVAGGMKLGKGQKTNQFLESLKAEGEVILDDAQLIAVQSRLSSVPPSDPISVTIEEKLNVTIKRDDGVNNFDIQGTLALQVLNDANGFIQLQIENQNLPGLSFKTHPNIDKEIFNSQKIVGAKDPNRPFPSGQNETPLVKWRIQELNEASLPLAVNCWPSVSGNETFVNIEYEALKMFDLHNVIISIPLPALREAPSVRQIDGEWKYDSRNPLLEWSVILIDQSNRSGSMEFVVPAADPSSFFPISVRFSASNTFSDLKVGSVSVIFFSGPISFRELIQCRLI